MSVPEEARTPDHFLCGSWACEFPEKRSGEAADSVYIVLSTPFIPIRKSRLNDMRPILACFLRICH